MDQIGTCSHLSLNYDSITTNFKRMDDNEGQPSDMQQGRWIGSYTLLLVTPQPISICHPIEPRRGNLSHTTLGIYNVYNIVTNFICLAQYYL